MMRLVLPWIVACTLVMGLPVSAAEPTGDVVQTDSVGADGAAEAAQPNVVDLIDAHGVRLSTVAPSEDAEELRLTLELTPLARELLLEDGLDRPEHHELYYKLSEGDEQAVVDAVGRCWQWFDHVNNGREYPPDELSLPKLRVSHEPFLGPLTFRNHHGECTDGYFLHFRKKADSRYWWFDAGREFKGDRATVKARLHFDNHGNNYGEVSVDGDVLFHCVPGADTYEGEFVRRFRRSRLWEHLDKGSFPLMRSRLELVLARDYDVLKAMIRTHPDGLRFHIDVRLGASANVVSMKALKYMVEKQLVRTTTIEGQVEVGTTAEAIFLPGATIGGVSADARAKIGVVDTVTEGDKTLICLDYEALGNSLVTERSALLYLVAVQQAIGCVKPSMPDEDRKVVLGDVLAEGEFSLARESGQ